MEQATIINEENKNINSTLELAGASEPFEVALNFKATADEKVQIALSCMSLEIFSAYQNVAKGYYELLGKIAKCLKSDAWKELDGISSFNSYLIGLLGCSKATASELKLVAERFYTSKGELIRGYDCFTYSELILLAKVENKEAVGKVALAISKMPKHKRADVVKAIKDAKLDGIGYDDMYLIAEKKKKSNSTDENESIDESTSDTDASADATDASADGTDASADGTDTNTAEGFVDVYTKTQLLADLNKIASGKLKKTDVQELAYKIIKAVECGNITTI